MSNKKISELYPAYVFAQRNVIAFEAMKKRGDILKTGRIDNSFVKERLRKIRDEEFNKEFQNRKKVPMWSIAIATILTIVIFALGINIITSRTQNTKAQIITGTVTIAIAAAVLYASAKEFKKSYNALWDYDYDKSYQHSKKNLILFFISAIIMIIGELALKPF